MTYQATLDYLYSQLPMYQRVGAAAMKKDLNNILALCEALNNPHQKFKSIHIAGTNGKGSTAHMLSAILQSAGLKTGLYTSPHYKDFRERIKINGQLISEAAVIDFVDQHKDLFESIQPSFFEITVAMAFHHFAHQQVDIAVIETGLGGRLDSTNILSPILSLITNISYDHQQFLGDTLPEIAGEKAGIIKENTPVIISERQAAVQYVFKDVAEQKNAPLYFAEDYIHIEAAEVSLSGNVYRVADSQTEDILFDNLQTDLYGSYQQKNLGGVLHAVKILNEENISVTELDIRQGLRQVKSLANFMGRWQKIADYPLTLCDSGHNAAGLKQVVEQLSQLPYRRLHMVIGMVKDKDHDKVISMLPEDAVYHIAKPDIPRGMDAVLLLKKFKDAGRDAYAYSSVPIALRVAQTLSEEGDLVFVGGSIFVVGEVL